MKIKSIAAICKKNKNIVIFERYSDDGDILTQYIGDGSAVYPVIGLPPLDAESLLTIFDVPEKDRDNYFVKTLGVPAGISFEDTDETERHVEREGVSIIYSGRTLYDGIGTGRYCLEKLGYSNIRYYATEIDKHAIEIAKSNYPDIVECGDAFAVREEEWNIKQFRERVKE